MKIKYVGQSTIRIIDRGEGKEPYIWNLENGYVQDVTDPEILENLLTYPYPDFEPVIEEETEEDSEQESEEV